jgi:hypothetical protein
LHRWRTHDAVTGTGNGHTGTAREVRGSEVIAQILRELAHCNIIAIGPLVRSDGRLAPRVYCCIASHDGAFFTLIAGTDNADHARQLRTQLINTLQQARKVVRVCNDELALAKCIEKLWPSQQTREILAALKAGPSGQNVA